MSICSKQRSEANTLRYCAEAVVWSDRMLTALVNGVKGGKWYSLMDKVYSRSTLMCAWRKVRANKGAAGVDGMSIKRFERQAKRYINELHESLKSGTYRPQAVKRVYIDKSDGRKRPLGIPTIKDRVVQMAIKLVIEPIFEKEFSDDSYGFRPNRSAKDALREVNHHLRSGSYWVVDADIKGYFDAIDHGMLRTMLQEHISDHSLLDLIDAYLCQNVVSDLEQWTPVKGSPQGAVLSPLLANIYLTKLDENIGYSHQIVRYADDFVILCKSQEEATSALDKVVGWMEMHKLTLHPTKTKICNEQSDECGFDFLGYTFVRGERYVRKASLKSLRDKIREKTKRQPGKSIVAVIADLNTMLRGWFEYFKHAQRFTFSLLDGFIRRRLRSILRKFNKKKGGTGRNVLDHVAWPNIFFAKLGLFTLHGAYESASESRS